MENAAAYIPTNRQQAMIDGTELPTFEHAQAALNAFRALDLPFSTTTELTTLAVAHLHFPGA